MLSEAWSSVGAFNVVTLFFSASTSTISGLAKW